jgi:hypothetical protein
MFIEQLKQATDPEDITQIFATDFAIIVKKFGFDIKEEDLDNLIKSFPGRDADDKKRINI